MYNYFAPKRCCSLITFLYYNNKNIIVYILILSIHDNKSYIYVFVILFLSYGEIKFKNNVLTIKKSYKNNIAS